MSEKEKRKEKPKRGNRRFVGLGVLFILLLFAGLVFILLPDACACSPIEEPETRTSIVSTNQWALTQISASATTEATTHNTSNTRATETMEYVQTLYYVRETMTALGDWTWREATATAEAERGQ